MHGANRVLEAPVEASRVHAAICFPRASGAGLGCLDSDYQVRASAADLLAGCAASGVENKHISDGLVRASVADRLGQCQQGRGSATWGSTSEGSSRRSDPSEGSISEESIAAFN